MSIFIGMKLDLAEGRRDPFEGFAKWNLRSEEGRHLLRGGSQCDYQTTSGGWCGYAVGIPIGYSVNTFVSKGERWG